MTAKHTWRTSAIIAALVPLCLAGGCQSEEETTADPFTEQPHDVVNGDGDSPDRVASHGSGIPGHAAPHRPGGGSAKHGDVPTPDDPVRPQDPVATAPDSPRPTDPAVIARPPKANTETADLDPPHDPTTPNTIPDVRNTTDSPSTPSARAVSLPKPGTNSAAPRSGSKPIELIPGSDAAKPRTNRPTVIRLPLGLTRDKPADADKPVPRDAPDASKLPALPLPPPSDRLTALDRVRASEYEDFIFRFDGDAPRLLTRAEAITALRSDQKASVVVLPLTAEDANILGRWIQRGRTMKAPQPWMTQLNQSAASRTRQNDRRQAELDRVRRQRQKLRDNMYRLLLGDTKPAPK